MSGTLTPKPTALALAPGIFFSLSPLLLIAKEEDYLAVCAGTPTPSSGNMDSCVAGSASVAMPRKLDSLSTAEEFMLGRTFLEYEPLIIAKTYFDHSHGEQVPYVGFVEADALHY
ncbi:hypothetical protein Godav_029391 [Gossypium davidsonii]|uniref:Uncharacterized protein n=1 Tax=Gossypium davidsonii TaxID=34287 RepID=A0A7J8TB38_GOSDV|nr:hypothetical protein [Gossypium davidsonii]